VFSRRLHSVATSSFVFLLLIPTSMNSVQEVLCVTSDGRIQVESSVEGVCAADEGNRAAKGEVSDGFAAQSMDASDDPCGECVDLPLVGKHHSPCTGTAPRATIVVSAIQVFDKAWISAGDSGRVPFVERRFAEATSCSLRFLSSVRLLV